METSSSAIVYKGQQVSSRERNHFIQSVIISL